MSDSPSLHIVAYIVGLLVLGFAAAGHFAFGYLNAARLRHLMQQGASRSQAMGEVVRNPGPFLSSIVLLNMAAVAALTLVVFDFSRRFVAEMGVQVVVVVVGGLLALAVQIVARGVTSVRPERAAYVLYTPLRIIAALTAPIVQPWYALTDRLLDHLAGGRGERRLPTTEEDLRVLVDAVEETEALEEDEREMITSIFEMSDREVSEIMVPRLDIVGLEARTSVADGIDLLVASGHSRVPVYEEDLDHILGLVHLRDLARELRTGRGEAPVGELARAVHVVPETKKIDELLHEFQEQHIQMAIVADEYGGTAGVVTIEDLLEEIVGEIRDEYDVEEDPIQLVSDREAYMDARVSIHDANEALPLNLDDDNYDTIGGLVYEELSKVPVAGDVVRLERATIRVISTKGRRVQRVHVYMEEPSANHGSEKEHAAERRRA